MDSKLSRPGTDEGKRRSHQSGGGEMSQEISNASHRICIDLLKFYRL